MPDDGSRDPSGRPATEAQACGWLWSDRFHCGLTASEWNQEMDLDRSRSNPNTQAAGEQLSHPNVMHSGEAHLHNFGRHCDGKSKANEDYPLALRPVGVFSKELVNQAFYGV